MRRPSRLPILMLGALCALVGGCDTDDDSSPASTSSQPAPVAAPPTRSGPVEPSVGVPRAIARFKATVTEQQARTFQADGRTAQALAQLGSTSRLDWANRTIQVVAPAPLGEVNLARIRSFLFLSGLFESVSITG